MSLNNIHDEWLALVEVTGPFLAPPVLNEAFPQGLDLLDPGKRKRLRQTYEEWREALDSEDPEFLKLHQAWIKEVISNCLGFNQDSKGTHLKFGAAMPTALVVQISEQGITLSPEYALVDEQQINKPLLLVQSYASGVDLQAAMSIDGWSATPADRMVQLCRSTGCRLGLVTDGERWMLIDAPVAAVTTFASWYARLWIQEPITLQAFVHLMGIRRFFVAAGEQIPALIDKSLQHQDEVTAALGEQVQRAVEVLIQSLDRADQDRNRELLKDVTPAELYEAGLTVMMRLVFLLSAEERGLLLMGDECYEENYAISTLRMQLRSESEEILERRWDAWSRLLSVFRAVYGGIDHENMRLPALGGSLFDTDRFPFLEGREKGSDWHKEPAKPLPIDNRTVLLLLEAIQQYQGRSLSYRALDVEQIGYVYEGLLERTVKRTSEVILDVGATRSAEKPLVSLSELESLKKSGESALLDCLVERTGSSIARVRNALEKPIDEQLSDRLLAACMGNIDLRNQIKLYANLLRIDPWGYPLVYPADSFVVDLGSDRRETGSHYTPKSLTEEIVAETLTPVVYIGPAESLDRGDWKLKAPDEILQLKICDPAMGSGAFLVQACRFLSDRLLEAWRLSESSGAVISSEGDVVDVEKLPELMPADLETRTVIARRLIAERCLYGVDINPLAVELAKLSIWLVTLSKGRPFGFLDHNLRYGDTLLGLQNLDQLLDLSMVPSESAQQRLFGKNIQAAVNEAIELRKSLRLQPIRNINDVELMAKLDTEARERLNAPNVIANAFIGSVFALGTNNSLLESAIADINISAAKAVEGDLLQINRLKEMARKYLSAELPIGKEARKPFHWPLEFPEIFSTDARGFDAIVGNPPFLGGQRITGVMGTKYRDYLVGALAEGRKGSADLVAYFFLRVWELVRSSGSVGLIASKTIAEGDTRQVGLEALVKKGAIIIGAYPNQPWPGAAAVVTSRVNLFKGVWAGKKSLLGKSVSYISPFLSEQEEWSPKKLRENEGISFQGSIVLGMGFVLNDVQAKQMLDLDINNREVIFPYMTGEDLNTNPKKNPSRWVINFWDWPEERAKKYKVPYEWIAERVKPERQRKKENGEFALRKPLPERWWQYGEKRPGLYRAIGRGANLTAIPTDNSAQTTPMSRVIGLTRVTKYLSPCFLPNDIIYTLDLFIFALDSYWYLGLLQSSIHDVWARKQASTQGATMRYTSSDCFETLPLPNVLDDKLNYLAEDYDKLRNEYTHSQNLGLTKIYNKFHNPNYSDKSIDLLREKQVLIDIEVLRLYNWSDINLDHNFYEVSYLPENDRVRFTMSENSRVEILRRLSELNQSRHRIEVQTTDLVKEPKARKRKLKISSSNQSNQQDLGF